VAIRKTRPAGEPALLGPRTRPAGEPALHAPCRFRPFAPI